MAAIYKDDLICIDGDADAVVIVFTEPAVTIEKIAPPILGKGLNFHFKTADEGVEVSIRRRTIIKLQEAEGNE